MENPPPTSVMKITITKDGPYAVTGGVGLSRQTIGANAEGESVEWVAGETYEVGASYMLCRCGQSSKKPLCDGTHARIGFSGEETASRDPYATQAQEFDGPAMALTDAEPLCAFARFCDREGKVWNSVSAAQTPEARERFAFQ